MAGVLPSDNNPYHRQKFKKEVRHYLWDDLFLFRICADGIVRKCVADEEFQDILGFSHATETRGHIGATKTAFKVLQSGFYWPTLYKDTYNFILRCDSCQRMGNIGRKQEMPMKPILEVEIFDL